jgi:predicted DNA-binding helix-hairpin-helix protein
MREHRLYQADWLYRFYGFGVDEITSTQQDGMLDLNLDPKLAWALGNRQTFPVDINRAERETLLRVPGLGTKTVKAILSARRFRTLRLEDLARLGVSLKKVQAFIVADGWTPRKLADRQDLRSMFEPKPEQLSLL